MTLLETVFKIKPGLMQLPYVHAMWLEGSYATSKFHEQSDIDVWLDVDDDKFQTAAEVFEQALEKAGLLRDSERLQQYSDEPKLAKAKFYLNDHTDKQRIELDIQSHEREFVFSRAEHTIVVLFDKDNTITWTD